jgi:hypothetical protein
VHDDSIPTNKNYETTRTSRLNVLLQLLCEITVRDFLLLLLLLLLGKLLVYPLLVHAG